METTTAWAVGEEGEYMGGAGERKCRGGKPSIFKHHRILINSNLPSPLSSLLSFLLRFSPPPSASGQEHPEPSHQASQRPMVLSAMALTAQVGPVPVQCLPRAFT